MMNRISHLNFNPKQLIAWSSQFVASKIYIMNLKLTTLVVVIGLWTTPGRAQIQVEYYWAKIKHVFEPLAPLPPEKTLSLSIPDSLNYLLGKNEVRRYWSPYGLHLVNKLNEKTPADYTIRFELDGLTVLQTQIEVRESKHTTTGKEFFRHYLFSFPSRIVVIDNATKENIQTITITDLEDTFIRTLHSNFFITDSFDPNYKKEVGYDSLKTLNRIPETDGKVLRQLEGEFARDVIFDRMKSFLVSRYGKETFKAQLAAFNPKAKNRTADFSDFDTQSQKLIKIYEMLRLNWNDDEARKLLQDVEDFYIAKSETAENRFQDYIPMIINFNLAEINLIQNDFEKADLYYGKALAGEIPDAYFHMFCKPNYLEAKEALERRHMALQNKAFASPQRAAFKKPVDNTPLPVVSKGYIVTLQHDTVQGSFKDFEKATYAKTVMFTDTQGKEKTYNWNDITFASSDGLVFESMSGLLVIVIYHSPSIRVYRLRQTGDIIYSFPEVETFGKYRPFSRDDAANYFVNYNKQLSKLFMSCPAIATKIESGAYDLKSEKAEGHLKVIGDYESACGSGNYEKTFKKFQRDIVMQSYK